MTAAVALPSAFPVPVADLIPQARAYAERLGQIPSRNALMRELHIGSGKADALLAVLNSTTDTASPDPVSSIMPVSPAGPAPDMDWPTTRPVVAEMPQVAPVADPDTTITPPTTDGPEKAPRSWPLFLLSLPAMVAVWSGWVGLGAMTGFGIVHPLPGIADHFTLNTAITLPIGVEAYAAYAMRVWLSTAVTVKARRFAKWSALGALVIGALGQVVYHLMVARHITAAPNLVTMAVGSLPVVTAGLGFGLAHLVRHGGTR
jgi:hypothetical protein